MESKYLTDLWFQYWAAGKFLELPISDQFQHVSPYGKIESKKAYLDLVRENRDLFLGNKIELKDAVYLSDKAVVRYTMTSPTHSMEVSEWIYIEDGAIKSIYAYYDTAKEVKTGRGLDL